MKKNILSLIGLSGIIFLMGCGGTSKGENLEVPTDLPPICRDIDFVTQPDMREVCGVREVRYKAYKNIPQQRYLIKPKDASLVKTDKQLELRFANTLPILLSGPIVDEMSFSQEMRLQKIKNSYDYFEVYPKDADRIRIFKITIPTDVGNFYDFCFRVPDKQGRERTRTIAMGNRLEAMTCKDFDRLVRENTVPKKKNK
ncbi:MAG: hypothetical protein AUK31_07425 [Fibrobacteres bacterium CG2_30_45_31]|nr:MAG: hypothetical protein AUK31_07425 [Fibrobacteres bacterium CG2_30_45_31]